MMEFNGKTYCAGYDERCTGCLNEHRWNELIQMKVSERAKLQKSMHCIDESDCQANGMSEKELQK